MKTLASLLALMLLLLGTDAQVPLAQTNALALQWSYPTNGVTPDLGFVLYSTTNLALPATNWTVYAVVSATNQVNFAGTNYPATNGNSALFTWPVLTLPSGPQFFNIAASNLTGQSTMGMASNNCPEITPLEAITSFLIIEHP